jgi:hypothetical protein
MSSLPQIYLPDPLAQWPWPRKLSEHYAEVKPESDGWLRSFQALDAKSQRSFDLCNFCQFAPYFRILLRTTNRGGIALLGSLVYPLLDKGLSVYRTLGSIFY